jgi:hypothetical protein
MQLPEKIAHQVYDILVEIGAPENMRKAFVWTQTHEDCNEWRFEGKLGFGGKFWNEWSYIEEKFKWRVSCYSEDETPEREKLINETNQKLNILANTL